MGGKTKILNKDRFRFKVGNASDTDDVLQLCKDSKPVLAIIDAPYNLKSNGIKWDCFSSLSNYLHFIIKVLGNIVQVIDNGALYLWTTQRKGISYEVYNALKDVRELTFNRELVIETGKISRNKSNYPLNEQRILYYLIRDGHCFNKQFSNIKQVSWYNKEDKHKYTGSLITNADIKSRQHVEGFISGMIKPVELIERLILTSTNPNDVVLDLFCHSGSTAVAALETGRRCFTMDIDSIYIEAAINRIKERRQSTTINNR